MSFQKLLKMVDTRSKDSVFGYIRQSRENADDTAIPTMIQYCCLKYYFINEYFTKCGDKLQINDNGKIVSSMFNDDTTGSAHANIMIDPQNASIIKCKWNIKILKMYGNCYFGIDSSNNPKTNEDFTSFFNSDHNCYAFAMLSGDFAALPDTYKKYGERCCNCDVIRMELDVTNQTLKFYRNGKDLGDGPLKVDVSKKYHMAIAFHIGGCFEIVGYDEEYRL